MPADPRVSEAVMGGADALFREICRNIVKGEMRLQGDVPEALYANIGIRNRGHLAHDARRFLGETLDYLGGPVRGTWMSDTYPDAVGRKKVAGAVIALHRLLEGNALMHGYGEDLHTFSDIDTVWVTGMANAVTRAHPGGLIGIVVKDPSRRDHWALSNGESMTPLIFLSGFSRYDVEDFAAAGPVIAAGTVIRDESDGIVELRSVENCYTFPGVVFLRAIDAGRDLGLVSALDAVPSYYARQKTWYLRNEDIALEASGPSWDACVASFHRRFLDLWESCRDGGGTARIRSLLDAMCPFDGL